MDGSMYVAAFIVDRLAGKYIDLVAGEKKIQEVHAVQK